ATCSTAHPIPRRTRCAKRWREPFAAVPVTPTTRPRCAALSPCAPRPRGTQPNGRDPLVLVRRARHCRGEGDEQHSTPNPGAHLVHRYGGGVRESMSRKWKQDASRGSLVTKAVIAALGLVLLMALVAGCGDKSSSSTGESGGSTGSSGGETVKLGGEGS